MPHTQRLIRGLPERIKGRREALEMSQPELAHRMGGLASRAEVSQYENGRRQPSAAKLIDLARSLGCSVDWLLGLRREP